MAGFLKVFIFALVIIAFGIFAASCGNGNAQYRVVNAIPTTETLFPTGSIAVYVNGDSIFTAMGYGETEPSSSGKYQSVGGGTDTMTVYPNSSAGLNNAQVIDSALNLSGGNDYTVILTGDSTTSGSPYPLAAQVITDTNPIAASGDAEVRVFDASVALSIGVDIYAVPTGTTCCPSGTQVASDLIYAPNGSSSNLGTGYLNIGLPTSGSITMYVTAHNDTAEQIYHNTYTLTTGQNYTFILSDANNGGTPPQFFFLTP